jgi:hypothetical protein
MPFRERKPPREYMRCCFCGRLQAFKTGDGALPEKINQEHALDIRVQEFLGNGTRKGPGFAWSQREMTMQELEAVELRLVEITERVRAEIDARLKTRRRT